MEEQNINQAKFLIKELMAILDIIPENKYTEELDKLLYNLLERLGEIYDKYR